MRMMDGSEIKVVGLSGQLSLGKRYAGKTFRLERRSDGSALLIPVVVVPEPEESLPNQKNRRKRRK